MSTFSVGKNVLLPYDAGARETMTPLVTGELVDVDVLRERDSAFRRFVFAALNRVAQATGERPDDFRVRLLIETGRFTQLRLANAKTVLVVHSMKRHAMNDKELRSFFVDARDIILQSMLPRFTEQDRDEIETMLKGGGVNDHE